MVTLRVGVKSTNDARPHTGTHDFCFFAIFFENCFYGHNTFVLQTVDIFLKVGYSYVTSPSHTPCAEKGDRQYFGRNFDTFRQLFIIFGKNHPDNPFD